MSVKPRGVIIITRTTAPSVDTASFLPALSSASIQQISLLLSTTTVNSHFYFSTTSLRGWPTTSRLLLCVGGLPLLYSEDGQRGPQGDHRRQYEGETPGGRD